MDVDDDNQFHSQIYTTTNKYNNDNNTTPNSAASSAAVLAQVQPEHDHQLFRGWHNSSRIFRVSRASGGKDRHSKVLTSKGLRDRRVRLSVSTAIQFYDLQDRLGYDQPSKAVEWLIKAAADSIAELPSLHGPFPDCVDAKLGFHESSSAAADAESQHQQQKNLSASSTSETSKGSGLSLTRTDVRVNQRVKARERARERAKEKECESEHQTVNEGQRRRSSATQANSVTNPISFSSTFTELLTGGNQSGSSPSNLNNSTAPMMDYFTNAGMISTAPARSAACLFLGQTQMGISMNNIPTGAFHLTTGDHHPHHDVHHFSFGHQNLIPSGNDDHQYDLNFTISQSSPSGVAAGFNNRGTLQSNSPASSLLHHHHNLHQRYTNNNAAAAVSMEGSNVPAFFMTTTTAPSSMDNHHFSTGLDGGLHLYYGDHKDKGKN